MRTHFRVIGTGIATAVFSVSLLAAPAFAASAPQQASATSVERPNRPERVDRPDHERRFCVKLGHLLRRLVEKGVITAQEALRIYNAVGCVGDLPTTDRPATTTPASN